MKEITLSTGVVVRVRPVPTMMVVDVLARSPELRPLPIPLVEVKGVAGTETMPARPGQKEYEEWMRERAMLDERRAQLQDEVVWAYGIVDWRLPKTSKFSDQPPKGWKYPAVLVEFGIEPREGKLGRRLDYIKFELLPTPDDVKAVQDVMYSTTAPLDESEVDTARDLFPGDAQGPPDTESAVE